MKLPNPNRRHKVGLLLVLAAAGFSLILDASSKQVVGVVLVGLAGAWIVGDLAVRTLRLLTSLALFVVGLSVIVVPVLTNWKSYQTSSKDYQAAIADLRKSVEKTTSAFTLLNETPAEQYAYLSRMDRDFAKATPADQQAYVEYLTKRAESSTPGFPRCEP